MRGSKTALTSPAAWDKEGYVLAWQAMGKGDPQQGQDEMPVLLSCSVPACGRHRLCSPVWYVRQSKVKNPAHRAEHIAQPHPGGPRELQLSLAIKKVNTSFSKTRLFFPSITLCLHHPRISFSRKSPLPHIRMLIAYNNKGRVMLCLQESWRFPCTVSNWLHRAC